MLNKKHITRGEAVVRNRGVYIGAKIVNDPYVSLHTSHDEDEANLAFIADCFNGITKTDKTYSELMQENQQLKRQLSASLDAEIELRTQLLNK